MRVLGYARVSSEEQAESGAGLAAQRRAIRDACAARGYELVEIVQDAGWSGKSLDRPGIAAALARLDSGEVAALVVSKLDRLSRSLIDFAGLMERSRREGWALIALDLGVDTTTPAGELVANVMASVAQWERRTIGARTKEALAARREAGVRLGRPRTMSDEVVGRIVAERERGLSLPAIANLLNAEKVPTAQDGAKWYPSTVRKVLVGQGLS